MFRDKSDLVSALGAEASVAEGFDRFIEQAGYDEQSARRTRAMFRAVAEVDTSGPAEVIALSHWWEESGYAGGDHLPVGGYERVVDALAEGLDIRLDRTVVSVAYDDSGVRVRTSSGAPRSHGSLGGAGTAAHERDCWQRRLWRHGATRSRVCASTRPAAAKLFTHASFCGARRRSPAG